MSKPRIPPGEFEERRRRLRERMATEQIDVFVAYSDDRATFGQQHARYLFDYQPHFEPALTVVPLESEAFVATGPESEELRVLTQPESENAKAQREYQERQLRLKCAAHPDDQECW